MSAEYGVGDVAVRDNLYGAVVVTQLLLCYYIGVVAVYMAVYAYDAAHYTRNCTNVVRHHDYGHLLREVVQEVV